MTRKAPLRVVAAGEAARKPLSASAAAEAGDYRALLVAMRARIATDVDNPNTPARDLAALTRRLREIAKEIEAIDSHEERDEIGAAAAVEDEEWAVT